MCSATFIPAENSALLYLHALIAKWTTAIVSKFIAFLKADSMAYYPFRGSSLYLAPVLSGASFPRCGNLNPNSYFLLLISDFYLLSDFLIPGIYNLISCSPDNLSNPSDFSILNSKLT